MHRNRVRIQIYQQKLLKRMPTIPAINASINKSEFLSFLMIADAIPVYKKASKKSKHNYLPISILKNISKAYERVIFKQIGDFMENVSSKFQCGFRKG